MRITTNDQVNARTADGRVYSAMAGATTDVDDDDENMVAMFRDLAARGLVGIAGDDEDVDEESEPVETADDDDTATSSTPAEDGYDAIAKPYGKPADTYDNRSLADLRELARDRGLPVSGTKDELITRLRA
jgi:hypothetical protein